MNDYRFTLEPYKSTKDRYYCPSCNKKTFTRYIDIANNEHIAKDVGICNRLIKCDYHYPPKAYFQDNKLQYGNISFFKKTLSKPPKKATSYIDNKIVKKSINYDNNLINFLEKNLFGKEITREVIDSYRIGSSNYWKDKKATVFWQIDKSNKVRTGRVMLYDNKTGKRVKEPRTYIHWVHSILKIKDFNLQQCLFGLHLVDDKPVAIVESEKTAIIASVYLPEFTWLATGGLHNLSEKMLKPIISNKIIIFPDAGCYEKWLDKASKFNSKFSITFSDLLYKNISEEEKEKGYDIADYLINLNIDYKKYI